MILRQSFRMKKTRKSRTTLRRRMILQIGLMVVSSLLIGVGAILGINGLHQDMGVAVQGYQQLRQIYEVGFQVATARESLAAEPPDLPRAMAAIETARLKLGLAYEQSYASAPLYWLDESRRTQCDTLLQNAQTQLKNPAATRMNQSASVNDVMGELAALSADVRTTIDARQESAQARRRTTQWLIVALSAVVVIIAVAAGIHQYRSVVRPLDALCRSVRGFAGGRFSQRSAAAGDQEFVTLANDFNHMADELEGLYRELEQKVEVKSKELVRSERLASVGYLAAGVAHEINNPLGIITGYGERLLELLQRGLDKESLPRTQKTIAIICQEAFRCKDITDRLLALARPGAADQRPVSLRAVTEDVVRNIGGLPEYANRRITLQVDAEHDSTIIARDGEMKQVIINLLLNALDAVDPGVGHVHVAVGRTNNDVELAVTDNGRGMTSATLDRIFEPFFTDKRGDRPGVGLGLSITHAIVISHSGRITADSNGAGRGSRFTVQFPAAPKGVEVASC